MNPPGSLPELDRLPFPDYRYINLSDYAGSWNHAYQDLSRSIPIVTSRGCAYRCFYCHDIFGKKIRRRSPENVIQEMRQHIEQRGIREFYVSDDLFNLPMASAKAILKLIIQDLPRIRISSPNGLRADQIDDEMVDLFEAAGTTFMSIAIESGNRRLQKLMRKNLRLNKAKRAMAACSERFFVQGFFMVGFPTETYAEAMETLGFAEEVAKIAQPELFIVRVFERTPLWSLLAPNAEQRDRLIAQQRLDYSPKMFENPAFYGDLFPESLVPLKSSSIQQFRFEWYRRIILDTNRISHRNNLLDKFWTKEDQRLMAPVMLPPLENSLIAP